MGRRSTWEPVLIIVAGVLIGAAIFWIFRAVAQIISAPFLR